MKILNTLKNRGQLRCSQESQNGLTTEKGEADVRSGIADRLHADDEFDCEVKKNAAGAVEPISIGHRTASKIDGSDNPANDTLFNNKGRQTNQIIDLQEPDEKGEFVAFFFGIFMDCVHEHRQQRLRTLEQAADRNPKSDK
jgi:hypothetical protein